ncbi:MAG: Gldg family protein [Saprospiraceae bacterium]|nr:Gldg family protein [Saprospiraceae bacterium]
MLKSKYNIILIVLLAFVALNYFSKYLFVRLDLTENNAFTLSKATKEILKSLDENIEVIAYFSEGLPVDIAKSREELDNLLNEYANLSKGKLTYRFINPNESAATEEEANKEGIRPVMINVREKDQAKQQKAYLGAVIKVGDAKDVVPVIQPGIAMEYAFTTGIKKLVGKNKPKVGFVQGHGEATLQDLAQAYQELSILYQVNSSYVEYDTVDLSIYKTLVMIKPNDSIPPDHLARLDQYLANGGNLVLAYNQVEANIQYGMATPLNTGIKQWLSTKGLEVEDALVRDTRCGQVNVTQQQGFFSFSTPVQFPYLPLIQKFSGHPLTKGLEQVMLEFASPINFTGNPDYEFTPILYTSEKSSRENVPLQFNVQRNWTEADFTEKNIAVGGVLKAKAGGSIIVITDGDFAINGKEQRRQSEDNISLLVNSIDYLSDDTGLIDLRTKSVETRPIEELTDSKRNTIKYLNFLLPIGLVVVYGIFRSNRSRQIRMRRMEERY